MKNTMRYHLTHVKGLLSRRQEKSVAQDEEKREDLCTVGGKVNR